MPVNLTRIYTRHGDGGETHPGDMSRVPETPPRIEAYGAAGQPSSPSQPRRCAVVGAREVPTGTPPHHRGRAGALVTLLLRSPARWRPGSGPLTSGVRRAGATAPRPRRRGTERQYVPRR